MTEINIITTDFESAKQIRDALESEALIINSFIAQEATKDSKFKITAQSRAVFFEKIKDHVMEISQDRVIAIYSKPIVNMQWEQADFLEKPVKIKEYDIV